MGSGLNFAEATPGRSGGKKMKIPEATLKAILDAVKRTKTGAVSTSMKEFLKEIDANVDAEPSNTTYSIRKYFKENNIPLKPGYADSGKTIKFYRHEWEEEEEPSEEESEE